tara:strand:- start:423 stop:1367 length:945 start_codon:yes stop_codon:yes gene_type:complete
MTKFLLLVLLVNIEPISIFMKFKSLFLILIAILFSQSVLAKSDSIQINKNRVLVVSSSLLGAIGGSYWYIQNSWWSDKQVSFHFDDGADLTYALNVDKIGHFLGGVEAADIFASSMKWSGMQDKQAIWYGAIFGSSIQLAIEMKDAYAPYWGFSKWDLALGSAGAFWPVGQHYISNLKAIDVKLSYYRHSDVYWELERQRGKNPSQYAWHDDYVNQTYWLSFDVNHFIETCCWPEWLNLSIGFGLDDTQYLNTNNTKKGGNNEWYIAFDYDIPKMLNKWDSPLAKKVKHWLNYIHFPAPTIRLAPKARFYPLFL